MELRPVQAALLAGRAASRWAIATPTMASRPPSLSTSVHAASLSRSFSSTCAARQEAEATAPIANMADYFKQNRQQGAQPQQEQQAQEQPQPKSPLPAQQSITTPASNNIFISPAATAAASINMPWLDKGARSNRMIEQSQSTSVMDALGIPSRYTARPTAEDIDINRSEADYEKPEDRKLRLRPVVGRTVDFMKMQNPANRDFARGLAQLSMACKVNRVNADSKRQRFHERPGLRKKRQKSERWRRRFADGFKATCSRVSELARQGW